MQKVVTDVVIVGAGPYGLSIAAHLRRQGVPFRIFGRSMQTWRDQMPAGMCLKSEGFASNLSDPEGSFTLSSYSRERGLPYEDIGRPVSLETFIQYGLEFQRRLVPTVEETDVTLLARDRGGFTLCTGAGESLRAKRVLLAVGITHFAYIPPVLSAAGPAFVHLRGERGQPGPARPRDPRAAGQLAAP